MSETCFVWDPLTDAVLHTADKDGDSRRTYTVMPDYYGEPVSVRNSTESSFFHFDAVGSTRTVTASDQSITGEYTYDAFGTTTSSIGSTDLRYRFQAAHGLQEALNNSVYYARRRFFSTVIGRWLSADPIKSTMNGNQYIFEKNAPLTYADPSGMYDVLVDPDRNGTYCPGCGWGRVNWVVPNPDRAAYGGLAVAVVQRICMTLYDRPCKRSGDCTDEEKEAIQDVTEKLPENEGHVYLYTTCVPTLQDDEVFSCRRCWFELLIENNWFGGAVTDRRMLPYRRRLILGEDDRYCGTMGRGSIESEIRVVPAAVAKQVDWKWGRHTIGFCGRRINVRDYADPNWWTSWWWSLQVDELHTSQHYYWDCCASKGSRRRDSTIITIDSRGRVSTIPCDDEIDQRQP